MAGSPWRRGSRPGSTRIAAPVGQARTQAGPPSMPLHMSHLTASLCVAVARIALGRLVVAAAVLARTRAAAEQQPTAAGLASARRRLRHLDHAVGAGAAQLPQPMQVSSIQTSPVSARWIAFGGQSAMQCGCSQCRHEVGTWIMREGRPGLAVEARDAVMALGAGLLAIVAADAQRLVDQQDVGRLAEPGALEQGRQRPIARVLLLAGAEPLALLQGTLEALAQVGVAAQQRLERGAVDAQGLGVDRGRDRVAAAARRRRSPSRRRSGRRPRRPRPRPCRRPCARASPSPSG